jgi:hypothetical protein
MLYLFGITINNYIFIYIPHPFLSLFFPSSSISLSSILSPFRLHTVFLHVPFSPSPLSFRSIVSLSSKRIQHLLSSPSIQYLFSLSSFPHLNLAIIFLSFHSLFLDIPEFPLSCLLLYLDSFILSLLSCLSVSLFLSLSSTHSSVFLESKSQSFHFFTGIPVFLIVFLSLLLLRVFFLSSIPLVSFTLHLPCLAALFPVFTLSLFLLHSSLMM